MHLRKQNQIRILWKIDFFYKLKRIVYQEYKYDAGEWNKYYNAKISLIEISGYNKPKVFVLNNLENIQLRVMQTWRHLGTPDTESVAEEE